MSSWGLETGLSWTRLPCLLTVTPLKSIRSHRTRELFCHSFNYTQKSFLLKTETLRFPHHKMLSDVPTVTTITWQGHEGQWQKGVILLGNKIRLNPEFEALLGVTVEGGSLRETWDVPWGPQLPWWGQGNPWEERTCYKKEEKVCECRTSSAPKLASLTSAAW